MKRWKYLIQKMSFILMVVLMMSQMDPTVASTKIEDIDTPLANGDVIEEDLGYVGGGSQGDISQIGEGVDYIETETITVNNETFVLQTLTKEIDDITISVTGYMPENAGLTAAVIADYSEYETAVSYNTYRDFVTAFAYDITLTKNSSPWDPAEYDFDMTVSIAGLDLSAVNVPGIYNVAGDNVKRETVTAATSTEITVVTQKMGIFLIGDLDATIIVGDNEYILSELTEDKTGVWKGVEWILYTNGLLYMYGKSTMDDNSGNELPPWVEYADRITVVYCDVFFGKDARNWFSGLKQMTNAVFGIRTNTTNTVNMVSMFSQCTKLKELDLSLFNTANVVNLDNFIEGCSSLRGLNMSSFDLTKANDIALLVSGLSALELFQTPVIMGAHEVVLPYEMYDNINNASYTEITAETGGSVILQKEQNDSLLIIGPRIYDLINLTVFEEEKEPQIQFIEKVEVGVWFGIDWALYSNGLITLNGTCTFNKYNSDAECATSPWRSKGDSILDVYSNVKYDNTLRDFFNGTRAEYIIFGPDTDTSNVTYLMTCFYNCPNLKTLDLSLFDVTNVKSIDKLFMKCQQILSITMPNWNVSDATGSQIFSACPKLKTIDFGEYIKFGEPNFYRLFYSCYALDTDVSKIHTEDVSSMTEMFYGCTSMSVIDLSNVKASSIDNMYLTFNHCDNVTEIIFSDAFDTSNVTNFNSCFQYCGSITPECLQDIINKFEIGSYEYFGDALVTMTSMFTGCSLIEPDFSLWDMSAVKTTQNMFCNCKNMTSLDLTSWDMSHVTNITAMFVDCKQMTDLKINWIIHPTVTKQFLNGCNALSDDGLDFSNFDMSQCKNTENMFNGCSSANFTSLDLSSFHFGDGAIILNGMFENCENLIDINFGDSFITQTLEESTCEMLRMFYGCKNIYELDFTNTFKANVTNVGYMFFNCEKLDRITFGDMFNTSKLTSINSWFKNMKANFTIDYHNLDVSNVTDIGGCFYNCSQVNKIDLSTWDLSKAQKGGDTFFNLTGALTEFKTPAKLGPIYINIYKAMYEHETQFVYTMVPACSERSITLLNTYDRVRPTVTVGETEYNTDTEKIKKASTWHGVNWIVYESGLLYMEGNSTFVYDDDVYDRLFSGEEITEIESHYLIPPWSGTPSATNVYCDVVFADNACYYFNRLENVSNITFGTNADTTGINYALHMFSVDASLTAIDNMNVPNLIDANNMFYKCSKLKVSDSINTEFWNIFGSCENLINANGMFYGCTGITFVNMNGMNLSKLESAENIFKGCELDEFRGPFKLKYGTSIIFPNTMWSHNDSYTKISGSSTITNGIKYHERYNIHTGSYDVNDTITQMPYGQTIQRKYASSYKAGDNITAYVVPVTIAGESYYELFFTGYGPMYDFAVVDGKTTAPWADILPQICTIYLNANSYYDENDVQKLNNITSIGKYAFYGVDENAPVSFYGALGVDDKVKKIGDYAFYGCVNSPFHIVTDKYEELFGDAYYDYEKRNVFSVYVSEDTIIGENAIPITVRIQNAVTDMLTGVMDNVETISIYYFGDTINEPEPLTTSDLLNSWIENDLPYTVTDIMYSFKIESLAQNLEDDITIPFPLIINHDFVDVTYISDYMAGENGNREILTATRMYILDAVSDYVIDMPASIQLIQQPDGTTCKKDTEINVYITGFGDSNEINLTVPNGTLRDDTQDRTITYEVKLDKNVLNQNNSQMISDDYDRIVEYYRDVYGYDCIPDEVIDTMVMHKVYTCRIFKGTSNMTVTSAAEAGEWHGNLNVYVTTSNKEVE